MPIRLGNFMILGLLPALTSGACRGVCGTMISEVKSENGVRVTEIHSYGIELRNLHGYRGMSIGRRDSTYVHPLASHDLEATSGWGFVSLPDEPPIFTQSRTLGYDLAWEPSFCGMSLGLDSRSCARLDLRKSSSMEIHTSPHAPPHFHFQQQQP